MQIFAIIVIYNGLQRDWIFKCFNSIKKSEVPLQIIAIDNASTDGSVTAIKEHFPDVILIESKENLGFGGANNLGIKKALELGGDYFFLLNQDAWIEPDTVSKLIEHAQKNTEYGVLSPMHLNGKGNALDFNFSLYITPSFCKNLYSDFVMNKVENRIYESGFICAAAWLITKESLKKVGGFSPTFFHYSEDDNYVQRLSYKGLKIGILPHSKIYHDREDREKTSFHSDQSYKERALIVKFSNPNTSENLEKYLKVLKFKLKKARLMRRKREYEFYKHELNFLTQHSETILTNRNESISDKEYIFL